MHSALQITHNAGFFSCCSIKLTKIIEFFNQHHKEPQRVDSSQSFVFYKTNINQDVTEVLFQPPTEDTIEYVVDVDYHWEHQFNQYKTLDFKNINPFVRKYFTPSKAVFEQIAKIKEQYNIDTNKTIAVCYRGNDKCTETKIASYEVFLNMCEELHAKYNYRFMIQTDEKEFLESFQTKFPNSFYIEEIPTVRKNTQAVIHHLVQPEYRTLFGILILASIYLLSQCKILVTHSGNCGIWPVLYRGNCDNVYQYIEHPTCEHIGWC